MTKKLFNWQNLIICLVLLLPFERLLTFNLADYTVKPAYIIAVIIIICTLSSFIAKILSTNDKSLSATYQSSFIFINCIKSISPEEYLLLLFVLWAFASSIWSLAPKRTLIMAALLALVILIFILLRRIITLEFREKLISLVFQIGFILSIFAIIQFLLGSFFDYNIALLRPEYGKELFGFPRPQATFLEPLYLANFLLFPILSGIDRLSKISNKQKDQHFLILAINIMLVTMICAFVLTLSRGAYIALAVAVLFYLIYSSKHIISHIGFIVKVLLSCVAGAAIAFILVFWVAGKDGVSTFVNHAAKTSDMEPGNHIEELKNRGNTKDIALANFKLHPYLGIGLNAFGALTIFEPIRKVGDWQTVNNQYLEIAVETGIVGLVLFILVFSFALSYLLRKLDLKQYDNVVYLCIFLALSIHYLTFSTLYLLYLWVFFAMIWPKIKPEDQEHADS